MRRVIFTLLYDRGQFMLSRNFRLQAVGTIDWLFDNYDFGRVSHGLDELMVLDVSRGDRDSLTFADHVGRIASRCFIPMTVGGGVVSDALADLYMRSGADKLLVNSAFGTDLPLCRQLASRYGNQCIVAGIDYRTGESGRRVPVTRNGATAHEDESLSAWVARVQEHGAGEVLLQSVDRDGTGMGLDLAVFDELHVAPAVPCILMGGVGKADHIVAGLSDPHVDAVATANLFNFIGSTFLAVRESIVASGIDMPRWSGADFAALAGRFSEPTPAETRG